MAAKTMPTASSAPVDKTDWANATYQDKPKATSKLREFFVRTLQAGLTGVMEGEPGIGKTKQVVAMFTEEFPHGRTVYLNGPNLSSDDMTMDTPKLVRKDGADHLELSPALYKELEARYLPDGSLQPYVLIIDDPNQAGKVAQNVLMQVKNDMTINSFDLRANGCVGVFVLDNNSLEDTAALTTDLAQLDRSVTITVGPNDTEWRWALAQKYADVDLAPVFELWGQMPKEIRKDVPPRVLDHVLDALTHGYPGIVGLPLRPDGHRRRLIQRDGSKEIDRTKEFIDKIASAVGAPNPERVENIVAKAIRDAIANNWTILVQGPPGGGKTALTMATVKEELGGQPRDYYFSIPTTDPERFTLPLPKDDIIEQVLTKAFRKDEPKVLIFDEANRGGPAIQARKMEIDQEQTVAGQTIPGLKAVVNLENPPYVMGRKMSVNRRNRAQTERFTINLQLTELDINSNEWLLTVFPSRWADQVETWLRLKGEAPTSAAELERVRSEATDRAHHMVETVLEWWKNDLDDEGRQWVTSRGTERMVRYLLTGGDPDEALISLGGGDRAPVVTAGLRARLAERPMTGLQEIVADKAAWIERMREANAGSAVHGNEDTNMVQKAFQNAEVSQLEAHKDVVVELLMYLPVKYRKANLDTGDTERQNFWIQAMIAMKALKESLEEQAS